MKTKVNGHGHSPSPEADPTSIGNLALEKGFITVDDLRAAVHEQQKRLPLGEILLNMGKLTKDQLDELIMEQRVRRGEITDKKELLVYERQKLHNRMRAVRGNFQDARQEIQRFASAVALSHAWVGHGRKE